VALTLGGGVEAVAWIFVLSSVLGMVVNVGLMVAQFGTLALQLEPHFCWQKWGWRFRLSLAGCSTS